MSLTGQQYRKFSEALRDAFDYNELQRMLRFGLDKRIQDISLGSDFQSVVFDLIGEAERQGWTLELLDAARRAVPKNSKLMLFANSLGLSAHIVYTDEQGQESAGSITKSALQRMIDQANSPVDIAQWRENLAQVETRTCSIEIKNSHRGTGFLLGPDVIMTNYHVMKSLIEEESSLTPRDVRLRFDYKRTNDGREINSGTVCDLAGGDDWLIHFSPYSEADTEGAEFNNSTDQQLDYALLRLGQAIGEEPLNGDPRADRRGWVEVPQAEHDFLLSPALYIVQHPNGQPMKLAIDTNAVTGLNENGTRVRYRTNTDPGSSGSPCFNRDWQLVALHHSGDVAEIPLWNQGIPFSKIMASLEQAGLADSIGENDEE